MLARAPDEPIPDSLETLLGSELLDSGLLDRLDVISRKMLTGKLPGERRSKRRGASVEFDDFRQYTPGDDLRRIDWNIYARFDRLILKLFREDEDLGVHIVLDASPSMHAGSPNKAIHAHRLAAVLSYLALVSQNRVGLSVLTTGRAGASGGEGQEPALHTLAPARGRQSLVRFTEFLLTSLRDSAGEPDRLPPASRAAVRVSHGDPLGSAIRAACSRTTGKGVFVVISDLLEPAWLPGVEPGPSHALNAMVGGGRFDAHLLQVLSPQELDPASGADLGLTGDVRLTDAETGLAAEVTVTPDALAAYRKRAKAYQDRLEQAAATRGVRVRLCGTSEPIGPTLVRSLARLGLLGAPGM
ncbi:MAG: DUF58 domain-containing protein [Planctomycetota bacterium]